jgi:hypothetical protein
MVIEPNTHVLTAAPEALNYRLALGVSMGTHLRTYLFFNK